MTTALLGFSLLVGHMTGDYLLQNDWIASRKASSTPVCLLHVVLYTLAVALLTRFDLSLAFYASVLVPHLIIDRFALARRIMPVVGQRTFKEAMGPWSVIIVDNTYHLLCLWLSVQLFGPA